MLRGLKDKNHINNSNLNNSEKVFLLLININPIKITLIIRAASYTLKNVGLF